MNKKIKEKNFNNGFILCINPLVHDFAAFDLWLRPVGLLMISSFLKSIGFEIFFLDCLDRHHPALPPTLKKDKKFGTGKFFNEVIAKPEILSFVPRKYKRYGLSPDIIRKILSEIPQPDAVFVTSMMTYWYGGVRETISIVKEIFPEVPVVLGGIYARLIPEHAKEFSGADIVCEGSDVKSVISILEKIFQKKFEDFYNVDLFIKHPPEQSFYAGSFHVLLCGIGCPFNCSYCASGKLWPAFKRRDIHDIIKEILCAVNSNIRDFAFYDDALLVDSKNFIKPLLGEVIKKKILNLRFHTPNGLHARFIDEEMARLLFLSGFCEPRLSFETSNPFLQKKTGGKVSNEDLLSAIKNLTSAGFDPSQIKVYLLVGMPGQNDKEIVESINFVKSLKVKPVLAEYSPIPGTTDWNNLSKVPADPLLHNNTVYAVWAGITDWEGMEKYKKMIRS